MVILLNLPLTLPKANLGEKIKDFKEKNRYNRYLYISNQNERNHLLNADQQVYEDWLKLYSKIQTYRRNLSYFLFVQLKDKSSILKNPRCGM